MRNFILPSKQIRNFLILVVFISLGFTANAQYKENTEVGFIAGASYYLGDLNTTHFNKSLPFGGIVIRKNIDRRFSYKAELLYLNISADDRNNATDTIAINRGLHFRSSIFELSGQIEFNFLPFELGNALYTWTPFVYTGISFFHFNPQAENKEGLWLNLQELGTEGQGSTSFPERTKYPLAQIAIPLGGGLKIAVNPSFNIILEYGVRKTFTDYLDDVSKTYPLTNGGEIADISNATYEMSDPTGTHIAGEQRGDPNKNDWYSFVGITLSFKLNNQTKGCDY
ncbi:MAG: hypothetical protein HN522_00850 [Flavobacteriales bacterium]|jgi:hypothetical protein|nr:hypothetical protein [Flavobacteriales bacterium]